MKNPCEKCIPFFQTLCEQNDYQKPNPRRMACPDYRQYLGYQEGLLEAESKKGEVAREIVEWLEKESEAWTPDLNATLTLNAILMKLRNYCRPKGWL